VDILPFAWCKLEKAGAPSFDSVKLLKGRSVKNNKIGIKSNAFIHMVFKLKNIFFQKYKKT